MLTVGEFGAMVSMIKLVVTGAAALPAASVYVEVTTAAPWPAAVISAVGMSTLAVPAVTSAASTV